MSKNTRNLYQQALDGTLPLATLPTEQLLQLMELIDQGVIPPWGNTQELQAEASAYPARWVTRVLTAANAARWMINSELYARSCQ